MIQKQLTNIGPRDMNSRQVTWFWSYLFFSVT